ncbi:SDR family oxidoreductase [Mucilaginibacter sp. SMC90]|uniref:SDR family oxidoreductase n=1 Tax=Mucilaginibacter TaxID=423349 RepID=UPI000E0DF5FA|nr:MULTISPECIES: SDR family oxidoreductase [Mucilaginibacter]UOE48823.1 SDR family oxidoreductase [Mucilaginibacter sp. SMC90]
MKIIVIGGTGMIGTQLVSNLRLHHYEVIAAAPANGINSVTGEGLADALSGAEVIVDVSNAPVYNESLQFFETSGNNLVEAARKAGVKHYIVLSIVGTPQLTESNYFRAKANQESIVRNSGIPYTIVRATQFFEFLGTLADLYTQEGIIHLTPATVQPISSADVAFELAKTALSAPLNGIKNIAGPERFILPEIVARYLQKIGDSRKVITDDKIGYDGVFVNDARLSPEFPDWVAAQTFDSWFAESSAKSLNA